MFQVLLDVLRPDREMRILDVGVTCDTSQPESNYFEKLYPYPERITCVGTEDGSHLEQEYPGLKYLGVEPGQRLPFRVNEFDIVFSNAVVEHVGSRSAQAAFVREICRVGKNFFITTPNRWFPAEHHTGLPFLHFFPPRVYRALIRRTPYAYWSTEERLNLLTTRTLSGLFPASVRVETKNIRIIGMTSNLIAYGKSGDYNSSN